MSEERNLGEMVEESLPAHAQKLGDGVKPCAGHLHVGHSTCICTKADGHRDLCEGWLRLGWREPTPPHEHAEPSAVQLPAFATGGIVPQDSERSARPLDPRRELDH